MAKTLWRNGSLTECSVRRGLRSVMRWVVFGYSVSVQAPMPYIKIQPVRIIPYEKCGLTQTFARIPLLREGTEMKSGRAESWGVG